MIKIAICDDELRDIGKIHTALNCYMDANFHAEIEIMEYNNPLLFLESMEKKIDYDILFLDICMPGFFGTEVAKEVKKRKESIAIVFVSYSNEFAVDAFSINAVHYLLKPFGQIEFDEAMSRG